MVKKNQKKPGAPKRDASETAEAVAAISQMRDLFALALRAARGDEAAMREVALKNLGPHATEAQIQDLVAQLRASQHKR
jgi:hypothetical protein